MKGVNLGILEGYIFTYALMQVFAAHSHVIHSSRKKDSSVNISEKNFWVRTLHSSERVSQETR